MAPPLHEAIASPKRFAAQADKYIAKCLEKDEKGKDTLITMVGLALHMKCDKQSLLNWIERYEKATVHDPDRLIFGAIKKAKAASELQLQQDMYSNRNAMSLALAKCMYGYVETQHVKVDANVSGSLTVCTGVPDAE